ncbi:unnamed protein product [Polarella glacialis]|uniref:Uncharacterized protein n=1 Tax=Polarella glacialis TaxID=89957 RepID=A0A813LVB5_POLGL|nr:unnamed protein product [Polarella glacialis]
MPVPWGSQRPVFPVPHISEPVDRGLALKRLRELALFLQQLCKMGIISYPLNPHRTVGVTGARVKWTQLTMHEITSEMLKCVIPRQDSCSWVELVTPGQDVQRCRFFCSHSWSEPFNDFMTSIERHALRNKARPADAYWICVFANNQWKIELGVSLHQSPFYQALRGAEMTVLMLDKSADALSRLWVIFELGESCRMEQALQVWSPLGRVGSHSVSSGPLVTALNYLKTEEAAASNACDQRQIRNYIVGVDDMDGIEVLADGSKRVKDEASKLDMACLSLKFAELNAKIKSEVLSNINHDHLKPEKEHSITEVGRRGITLAQLRTFVQDLLGTCGDDADWVVARDHFIRPRTSTRQCSYVELCAEEDQPAQYYLSQAYDTKVKDTMAAVEWHAEARELPDSTPYWIHGLALRHTDPHASLKAFSVVISGSIEGFVLVIDRNATVLTRTLPAFEMQLAIRHKRTFDISTPTGALATGRPFRKGAFQVGIFDSAVAERIQHYDIMKTQVREGQEEAKARTLNFIAAGDFSCEYAALHRPPDSHANYDGLNMWLRERTAGPLLLDAAVLGDLDRIKNIHERCPHLSYNDLHIVGSFGQTALHAAAADGKTNVIRFLFEMSANIHARDMNGDTPLHYAAFAAQTDSIQLLLECRASLDCTNFDSETPLDVAVLRPVFFQGRSYDDGLRKLKTIPHTRSATQILQRHAHVNTFAKDVEPGARKVASSWACFFPRWRRYRVSALQTDMESTGYDVQSDRELHGAVRSFSNLGMNAECSEKLRGFYAATADSSYKDWEQTKAASQNLANMLGITPSAQEAAFKQYLSHVLLAGHWDDAAKAANERSDTQKPWVVVLMGANGIRKTTSVYQPWFQALLHEALIHSGQDPPAKEQLPTGHNSFFRQLDFMMGALANEYFRTLFQKAGKEDDLKLYVSGKKEIFNKCRVWAEIWLLLLTQTAQKERMNVIVETTGKDAAMLDYVNHFFPALDYHRLVLRFEITDLTLAQTSIEARTRKELVTGKAAAGSDDLAGLISSIAGGSVFGMDELHSIQEGSRKVWQHILQGGCPSVDDSWHKAEIIIDAQSDKPWTAGVASTSSQQYIFVRT